MEIAEGSVRPPAGTPIHDRSSRWILAALLGGAAGIHLAMAPAHAATSVLESVGFAAVGSAQAALAVALLLRPSHRTVATALGVSVAVLAVWVLSRTAGLPLVGPAGHVEAVGSVDGLCVAFELLVIAGAVVTLRRRRPTSPRSPALVGLSFLAVAVLTTAALVLPTGQHVHQAAGSGHHEHGAGAAVAGHHDGHVSNACTSPVTAAQQTAADALVVRSRAAVARYADFAVARTDGFVPVTPEGGEIVHYAMPNRLADGKVLDPDAVESLVYARGSNGAKHFLGAMYFQDGSDGSTPTPGGCSTVWHAHDNLCLAPGRGMVAVVGPDGTCPSGSVNERTPMMLHVWSIDLPAGPFAELHQITAADITAGLRAAGAIPGR